MPTLPYSTTDGMDNELPLDKADRLLKRLRKRQRVDFDDLARLASRQTARDKDLADLLEALILALRSMQSDRTDR